MNAYLTPDAPSGDPVGRVLYIPDTLLPSVNGALQELAEEYNWEAFGDMTPEDAAYTCQLMLEDYYESEVPVSISPQSIGFPLWTPYSGTAFAWNSDTAQVYSGYWDYATLAINTTSTWKIRAMPGTYFFRLAGFKHSTSGIITFLMDGVSLGITLDMYAASPTRNFFQSSTTFTIPDDASHTIAIKMASKNASSTNYGLRLSELLLWRND